MKIIKLSIKEISNKNKIKTSGNKIKLLQTSGLGANFVAVGERKPTSNNKLSVAAYRNIYDQHAPRRKREDLSAHLLTRGN